MAFFLTLVYVALVIVRPQEYPGLVEMELPVLPITLVAAVLAWLISPRKRFAEPQYALLGAFLHSHHDLADCARIGIRFEHLVRRKALRSGHHGWRAYPVAIEAALIGGVFHLELGTQVVYSSTCPASVALSRQVVQQRFAADFHAAEPLSHAAVLAWLGSERGMAATPHAQHLRAGPRGERECQEQERQRW